MDVIGGDDSAFSSIREPDKQGGLTTLIDPVHDAGPIRG